MKLSRLVLLVWSVLVGCSFAEEEPTFQIVSQSFDFNDDLYGWEADFTDYPAVADYGDSVYQWRVEHTEIPSYLSANKALMLSCDNKSGDIFMFIKKQISGFRPNTNYNIVFEIEYVTNAITGQGVLLKAGASDLEPKKVIEKNEYVLNIDKGTQSLSGESLIVVGDIGTVPSAHDYNQSIKSNSTSSIPFIGRTNSKGEIWLIIGTDSGYLGNTTIYYTKVKVVLSASE